MKEARKKQEKTTTKNLKQGTTRHTLEIKQKHLGIIQALSFYYRSTRANILEQLINKGLEAIDPSDIKKATTLLKARKKEKKENIFKPKNSP